MSENPYFVLIQRAERERQEDDESSYWAGLGAPGFSPHAPVEEDRSERI